MPVTSLGSPPGVLNADLSPVCCFPWSSICDGVEVFLQTLTPTMFSTYFLWFLFNVTFLGFRIWSSDTCSNYLDNISQGRS